MGRAGRGCLFGFVWFVILWFGSLVIAGVIIGASEAPKSLSDGKSREQVSEESREAAERFFKQYGGFFLVGALAVAIVGSATGILPWTKPKRQPAPAGPYGQYPPYQPGVQPPYQYPQQPYPGQPPPYPQQQPGVPPVQYPTQPYGSTPPQYPQQAAYPPPPQPQQPDRHDDTPPPPLQV